ncbi:hypothetical protein BCL93_105123 [Onishia taeanensis]|uniref:NrS-1 polymerase-like helicase domain-containing protein n=1 Tax=Onishia taeanensis TaxID=284577 RepID=A0A328XY56_9GAMM|nr:DUF5906 domain-containing protein [Halomonas taeanensis]RAR61522.1 hypothetical protein BCL93_105123 [Halomonas taeanensis]
MFLNTSPTPDLTEARRLFDAGMKLVKLHPYTKQPIGIEWNKHSASSIDDDATGYGLPLAVNGLCSIDPDHVEMARVAMKAWGFDLDELLDAGVRTSSTRPDSGGRSAFLADPEGKARWLPFRVFDPNGRSLTLLELRNQSANLQDVVPGIVYASKEGEIYSQQYANGKRFDAAPPVPEKFLTLWRELSVDDDKLREYSRIAVDAIKAAGFTVYGGEPQYRPPMGAGVQLAFPAKGVRTEFNKVTTVESILLRHGYTYHERKGRWTHPGATGAPAIRPIPGKEGLWQSDHGGDPLHGTFDAWAAHVQLDHGGDVDAAIRVHLFGRESESFLDAPAAQAPAVKGLQQLMDDLTRAEPEEARGMVVDLLRLVEALPEVEKIDWHKQVRDVMHWNVAEFKAILKDLRGEWYSQRSYKRFDPYRYIYLAPRNEFYDTKSGCSIPPSGLNNKYISECDNASRVICAELDPDISIADCLGWNPTGATPPKRDDLIYEDEGQRMVNTWRGFALTPVAGDVSPWLEHAEYLIPDPDEREGVLDYLATLVQRVGSKPGFALIHAGKSGIGKDALYEPVSRAIGSASHEASIKEILEGWGDHRFQKKFLIITEVKKGKDRNIANAMKTIVSTTNTGKKDLNLKGGQVVTQVDCMGVLMMTNFPDGFTIEENDRRYFVVSSWVEPKDAEYYTWLHDWYRNDNGPAKVLNYLMQRDISHFNHNALPFVTQGARKMAQASRYDYEQDIEDMILEGQPPFHVGAVTAKELKAVCRLQGIKAGNNGLDEAMNRLGWLKLKGTKRVEGVVKNTPYFFAKDVDENATKSELYDLFHALRLASTTLKEG